MLLPFIGRLRSAYNTDIVFRQFIQLVVIMLVLYSFYHMSTRFYVETEYRHARAISNKARMTGQDTAIQKEDNFWRYVWPFAKRKRVTEEERNRQCPHPEFARRHYCPNCINLDRARQFIWHQLVRSGGYQYTVLTGHVRFFKNANGECQNEELMRVKTFDRSFEIVEPTGDECLTFHDFTVPGQEVFRVSCKDGKRKTAAKKKSFFGLIIYFCLFLLCIIYLFH